MYKLVFMTLCLHVLVAMGQLELLDEPYYGESQSPPNPIVALQKYYENMQAEINTLKTTVATLRGQQAEVNAMKTTVATLQGQQAEVNAMKTTVATLQGNQAEVNALKTTVATLQGQQAEVKALKTTVATLHGQQAKVNALKITVETMQNQLNTVSQMKAGPSASCPICRNYKTMTAFTAVRNYLPQTNIGKGQKIIIPDVISNLGGMYNPETGVFTAPVSGLYLFSATLLHEPRKGSLSVALMLSGRQIVKIHAAENMWDEGSQTVVLNVEKGQQVWLENTGENGEAVYGHGFSSFAGVLLG